MKTITLYASILVMTLFWFSAVAGENHLDQAIQHADTAVRAPDGKTIAEHAEMAKTHANAAKNEKNLTTTGGTHLDAGIRSLDQAIENGKLGAADSARKAAEDAVTHLKEASK